MNIKNLLQTFKVFLKYLKTALFLAAGLSLFVSCDQLSQKLGMEFNGDFEQDMKYATTSNVIFRYKTSAVGAEDVWETVFEQRFDCGKKISVNDFTNQYYALNSKYKVGYYPGNYSYGTAVDSTVYHTTPSIGLDSNANMSWMVVPQFDSYVNIEEWSPRKDIKYVVYIYTENIDDDNYSDVYLTFYPWDDGTTDEVVNIEPSKIYVEKDSPGYSFDHAYPDPAFVNGDGSTVIKLYYKRNRVALTFTVGSSSVTIPGKYGARIDYGNDFFPGQTINWDKPLPETFPEENNKYEGKVFTPSDTLYVDPTAGNDNNTGADANNPLKTIAKVAEFNKITPTKTVYVMNALTDMDDAQNLPSGCTVMRASVTDEKSFSFPILSAKVYASEQITFNSITFDGGADWGDEDAVKYVKGDTSVLQGKSSTASLVYIPSEVNITFKDCTFKNNCNTTGASDGDQKGGAVTANAGTVYFNNCLIKANRGYNGGGLCLYGNANVVIRGTADGNCSFAYNAAGGGGGAIYSYSASGDTPSLNMSGSVSIGYNYAGTSGGALYINLPKQDIDDDNTLPKSQIQAQSMVFYGNQCKSTGYNGGGNTLYVSGGSHILLQDFTTSGITSSTENKSFDCYVSGNLYFTGYTNLGLVFCSGKSFSLRTNNGLTTNLVQANGGTSSSITLVKIHLEDFSDKLGSTIVKSYDGSGLSGVIKYFALTDENYMLEQSTSSNYILKARQNSVGVNVSNGCTPYEITGSINKTTLNVSDTDKSVVFTTDTGSAWYDKLNSNKNISYKLYSAAGNELGYGGGGFAGNTVTINLDTYITTENIGVLYLVISGSTDSADAVLEPLTFKLVVNY